MTVAFIFYYKPDDTKYPHILGSDYQKGIKIYILNGTLALICYELQFPVVDIRFSSYTAIEYYQCHRSMEQPEESHT